MQTKLKLISKLNFNSSIWGLGHAKPAKSVEATGFRILVFAFYPEKNEENKIQKQ